MVIAGSQRVSAESRPGRVPYGAYVHPAYACTTSMYVTFNGYTALMKAVKREPNQSVQCPTIPLYYQTDMDIEIRPREKKNRGQTRKRGMVMVQSRKVRGCDRQQPEFLIIAL